jgi:hypothetical protein
MQKLAVVNEVLTVLMQGGKFSICLFIGLEKTCINNLTKFFVTIAGLTA